MSEENIGHALLRAQGRMPALQKTGTGNFNNKFVPLDQILEVVVPVLNEEGIILIQAPTVESGEAALTTTLLHADSGTSITSTMLLVMDKDTPQGQGSGITYARRYALQGMLGLNAEEDDDATLAEKAPRGAPVRRQKSNGTTPAPVTQVPAF